MRIAIARATRLLGVALCCCLVSFPRLSAAQAQNAATTLPDAPVITIVPSPDSDDRPSPPESSNQTAQASVTGQTPGSSQNQPNRTNQQDQKKPSTTTPSLGDLGFTPEQMQANAQMQAMLNKRTHMLKVHQTLGLITTIPMIATLITGPQAKAKGKNGETITEPTSANLDLHIALGGLTTAMYFTTAYYSVFAPKVPGVKPKGAIRLHRDLEWVHGPGMILTPILGIMAYKQENAGEKVHGVASYHGTAAYVTAAAYGASIVAVSWPIHWKFWKK